MALVPESILNKLRSTGLYTSTPFPDGHRWQHGVHVGKPVEIKGNKIEGFLHEFGRVTVDAPIVIFYSDGLSWIVGKQDHVPGPGPGDFRHFWETPDEAVADILDYYFGDSKRMTGSSPM